MNQRDLEKKAYQCLLLGEYEQAASNYEQAIELDPNVKINYWYLGLVLLIQGQEAEAQATWFMGIAEGKPEEIELWISELVEVLGKEARRRFAIADNAMALVIRESIQKVDFNYSHNQPQQFKFSCLDEEIILEQYIHLIELENNYCVDIAAGDGLDMSNTYFLFQQGWSGLAVECDSMRFAALAVNYARFANVKLSKVMVTPENVVTLLKANQVPEKFSLLSLDIDGYDYFVLDELLSAFRPAIICAEINEVIPPPIKFTVKWHPSYVWGENHFFGQSICQLNLLCEKYDYALVELHYNNAFLVSKGLNPFTPLTPEDAYIKGYLQRIDRKQRFYWNAKFEEIYTLPPEQALDFVKAFFSEYAGQFDCYL
jgi:tetratricopeptide (TPR) repeat protein